MSELLRETKNGWERISAEEKKAIFDFCEGYKDYLTSSKTERLAVKNAIEIAKSYGFVDVNEKDSLKPGDKVYLLNREKTAYFAIIGDDDITTGINYVVAHVDSPRIDIKAHPLYEDANMALLKTHYYGTIVKPQWTALPLSLIGIVYKKDGTSVEINIGEDPADPVFYISDIPPHLAKGSKLVEGENLNIIIGSMTADSEKDKFKTAVMEILNEKYGITEEDFGSAEIEAVPTGDARDAGIDRSLVSSYGQDDRVCAYTSLMAICHTEKQKKTSVCVLIDKEEVGSMGNTGMKGASFEYFTATLIAKTKGDYNEYMKLNTFRNSSCLSADVITVFDPNYAGVNDRFNASYLGHGVSLVKYTGSGGKWNSSDANAEFVSKIRNCLDENGVIWQYGELGKVDGGGGGTIAQFAANRDIDVIDCGTALFSLHAPFELASKLDVYMTYKAYNAFFGLN